MPDVITLTQLLTYLRKLSVEYGSQRELAKELGVSDAYLSDVLAQRRNPGKKLLLGLGRRECEPRYEVIRDETP